MSAITLAQVRALLAPQTRLLIGIAVFVLAGAVLEIAPPLILQDVIDAHLAIGRSDGLLAPAALYLCVVAALQGLGAASSYLTALAAQRALRALRVNVFAHLQRLPTRYFDETPIGDLISRCTADVDTIETLFSSGVANLIADLVRLVVIALAMLALSPALTLVAGLALPPLVWFTRVIQRRVLHAERASRRAVGALNTHLQEILGGVEVIRAFGQAHFFAARFGRALQATLNAYLQATRYAAVYTPIMVVLAALILGALLLLGAHGARAGWSISIGTLTAFVLLFRRFFTPITTLGEEWQTVQSAFSGAERVFQVMALPQAEAPTQPNQPAQNDALIVLNNITFGYGDAPVLHDVSLHVRAGEKVALVGRTGAGKSSIMHLVGGLYSAWAGQVRVCGQDPCAMREDERSAQVGVVPQMLHLFGGSVLENLTLGDAHIARADVEAAAQMTGAHTFIQTLPQGYDTPLQSGAGAQLSAGQQQLLALTRALVRCPAVLLLDEATAALDNASDAAFRAALRADASHAHRAVLIVAHRLSTAREADRVIVLENGRIIEQGPPEALAQRGGHFAALLALEAAGWDWQIT